MSGSASFQSVRKSLLGGERPDAGGIGLPALNIKRIVRFAFASLLRVRAVYPPAVLACFGKYTWGVVPSIVRNMSIKALTLS
jgi:hypothetical protein